MLKLELEKKHDEAMELILKLTSEVVMHKKDATELERKYESQLTKVNTLKEQHNKTLDNIKLICETFLDVEYPYQDSKDYNNNEFYQEPQKQREDCKITRLLNKVITETFEK